MNIVGPASPWSCGTHSEPLTVRRGAVYLDGDMMAFGDPDTALPLGSRSDTHVVVTPHRFASAKLDRLTPIVGRFNGGYAAFRNSSPGLAALAWWEAQCMARCPAVPASHAYADQKYLDTLHETYPGVWRSPHPGVNAAPWNIHDWPVSQQQGRVWVGSHPLVLYHFQGLRVYPGGLCQLYAGDLKLPAEVIRLIYRPYVRGLRRALERIRTVRPNFKHGTNRLFSLDAVHLELRRAVVGRSNLRHTHWV